jgi:TatA/E family protein of Tat protein translocase
VNIEKDLIIILLIALLVFGPSKLAGLGSALGKTIREFRKAIASLKGYLELPHMVQPHLPRGPDSLAPLRRARFS